MCTEKKSNDKKSFYSQSIELICEVIGIYESDGKSNFKIKFEPGIIELEFDPQAEYRLKDKLIIDGNFTINKILIDTPEIGK